MPLIHLLKCLGALLTSWCLLCSGASAADNGRILMVTEATFPPYEFREENAIMGIDPEIMREVARRAGKELVIEDMSFDSVITAVVSGKADVAASGITVTPERRKQVDFSIRSQRFFHPEQGRYPGPENRRSARSYGGHLRHPQHPAAGTLSQRGAGRGRTGGRQGGPGGY